MNYSAAQKKQAFENMGLQVWYPRYQLPNAQPVVVEALEELEQNDQALTAVNVQTTADQVTRPHQTTALQPSIPTNQSAPVEAGALAKNILNQSESKKEPEPAVEPDVETPKEPAFEYQTQFLVFGRWLIVVEDWATFSEAQKQSAYRLFANVYYAKFNERKELAFERSIIWPLFQNPNADNGITKAKAFFVAKLLDVVKEHDIELVVDSGQFKKTLIAEDDTSDIKWLETDNVMQLFNDPRAKARLWQKVSQSK